MFILNNEYMGMVRQWQDLTYQGRHSHSYSEALPDFVKLAEAYGWKGMRIEDPAALDDGIAEMLAYNGPGDGRLPRRQARQLLPDDPVGRGAYRDDPAGERGLGRNGRRGQGAGLIAPAAA